MLVIVMLMVISERFGVVRSRGLVVSTFGARRNCVVLELNRV